MSYLLSTFITQIFHFFHSVSEPVSQPVKVSFIPSVRKSARASVNHWVIGQVTQSNPMFSREPKPNSKPITRALTHSFTDALTHSLTYSLTHSLTHSLTLTRPVFTLYTQPHNHCEDPSHTYRPVQASSGFSQGASWLAVRKFST